MATIADYIVLEREFTLRRSQRRITFDRPTKAPLVSDLRRSPILAFTANPEHAKVQLAVELNGRPLKRGAAADHVTFTEGQPVSYHFVLDATDLFLRDQNNIIEFTASLDGEIRIRDVVLWFQREFGKLID